MRHLLANALVVLLGVSVGMGQITIPDLPPEAAGTDGALTLSGEGSTTIDLSQAVTGSWNAPSPQPGKGIYDPAKWAVVFKYSSVTTSGMYGGRHLYFVNHPSGAPVVWLVSGDVTIGDRSSIRVSGANAMDSSGFPAPGPGGFRGGRGATASVPGSAGFGPGGGDLNLTGSYAGGSFSTVGGRYGTGVELASTYGHPFLLPLIGGSGGAAHPSNGKGGSAGGGAILIFATGKITLIGGIYANAGGSVNDYGAAGSGGSIKLIAQRTEGAGTLQASGNTNAYGISQPGGKGRILVQANENALTMGGDPPIVAQVPIVEPLLLWSPDNAPKIRATALTVAGLDIPVPADPRASLSMPFADLSFVTDEPVTVKITANNIPVAENWTVVVRIAAKSGNSFSVTAGPLVGTDAESTTTATIPSLPRGFGSVTVRAFKPTTP